MTERGVKVLRIASQVLMGLMWIYFAIASYGAGEHYGPFLAFLGMLIWANAERDFHQAISIAKEAITGWRNLLERI